MNKQFLKIGLKILVAAGLLSWFLYRSDVNKIIENISSLSFKIFVSALILNLIYLVIKSFRWRLLLPQYSLNKLIELSFISYFYSIISAGQFIGEFAKIYIMGKGKKEAGQITMSVIIDKITGIIGLLLVAIFGLVFTSTVFPKSLTWTFFTIVVICLIFIFFIRLKQVNLFLTTFFTNRLDASTRFKRLINLMLKLIEAWYIYSKKVSIIIFSIFLSFVFQIILIGVYMLLSYGFGINISFFDWCWILGIISGLSILPITIAGIGVREGLLVGLLGFFMIAPEKALALSFSFFIIQLFSAAIGGIIEIRRTKIMKI